MDGWMDGRANAVFKLRLYRITLNIYSTSDIARENTRYLATANRSHVNSAHTQYL